MPLKFDCGCIIDPETWNPTKTRFDCEKTWYLIGEGRTRGVFQLETDLGCSIAQRVKPRNIQELAELLAILRPGTLEAIMDGKSLTFHYIDRKLGKEKVEYFHPALEPILKDTYSIIIYQEQIFFIAQKIAGFSMQEADNLRRIVSKKVVEKMEGLREKFINGCVKNGLIKEDGDQIFEWIKAAQRYGFCAAHAVGYAYLSYQTAYAKAHFPHEFFTSSLFWAKNKPNKFEAIKSIVDDAHRHNIKVLGPDFRRFNKEYELVDGDICWGLANVKGVGGSLFKQLSRKVASKNWGPLDQWTFTHILFSYLNKSVTEALIKSGALDFMGGSRQEKLYQFSIFENLTLKEKELMQKTWEEDKTYDLITLHRYLINLGSGKNKVANMNRIRAIQSNVQMLIEPLYELSDSPEWVADIEESVLGISLTQTRADALSDRASASCIKFLKGKNTETLACEIDFIKKLKIKNGKNKGMEMAIVHMRDKTAVITGAVFPKELKKYKTFLREGNIIIVKAERNGKFGNDATFTQFWGV